MGWGGGACVIPSSRTCRVICRERQVTPFFNIKSYQNQYKHIMYTNYIIFIFIYTQKYNGDRPYSMRSAFPFI